MKRRIARLGGLALLLAAGTALAAVPAADPPPPRSPAQADIEAWIDAYIVRGDDVEAAATDRMVLFYTPSTVAVTKDGVESVVHGEQFATQIIPPGPIRSFRDVWRFDCSGRRFMLVESEIFAKSNLQGPPVRLDTSMERWSQSFDEGVGPGSLIAQVCHDAGVALGLPPGGV